MKNLTAKTAKIIPFTRSIYTTQEATELFNSACVAFGNANGVPAETAINLLSATAVSFARQVNKGGKWWNSFYCNGDIEGCIDYLTQDGFIQAVAYYNTERLILIKNNAVKK